GARGPAEALHVEDDVRPRGAAARARRGPAHRGGRERRADRADRAVGRRAGARPARRRGGGAVGGGAQRDLRRARLHPGGAGGRPRHLTRARRPRAEAPLTRGPEGRTGACAPPPRGPRSAAWTSSSSGPDPTRTPGTSAASPRPTG